MDFHCLETANLSISPYDSEIIVIQRKTVLILPIQNTQYFYYPYYVTTQIYEKVIKVCIAFN